MTSDKIFLNVCVEDAQKAREAGATWDSEEKGWYILLNQDHDAFKSWLPRKYRPDVKPPYLVSQMVPFPSWYINLRSLLSKNEWDHLRKSCFHKFGHRCQVCGLKGPKWPVECNEQWQYIEETPSTGIQKLLRLAVLCPDCHSVKHLGKANVEGRLTEALQQLCLINGWSFEQAQEHAFQAQEVWLKRNEMEWMFDLSLLPKMGITEVRIQQSNFEVIPKIIGVNVLFET